MNKLARFFFDKGFSKIETIDQFFNSDLYVYLKSLYNKEPIISNTGFIKVNKENNSLCLYQHLYFDQTPDVKPEFYISLEGINISSSQIKNNEIGRSLFINGFAIINTPDSFLKNCISKYPGLNYVSGKENDSLDEPVSTFKFQSEIWSNKILHSIDTSDKKIRDDMFNHFKELLSFSDVLQSLDLFDVNFLKWTQGRSMKAHNGIDYRSFINIISYNSNASDKSRDLECGSFSWYDVTFNSILQQEFSALMDINYSNVPIKLISASTSNIVLINSFNPKFYHKVFQLEGENSVLYTSTANMTFSKITQDIDFQW